jgi:hypothetical protein
MMDEKKVVPRAPGVHSAEEEGEDDEWLLPDADDKPGFMRWTDALSSRRFAGPGAICVGRWLPDRQRVELLKKRGKWYATMGYTGAGGKTYLHPEEALALLDDGKLELVADPTATRSRLPPAPATAVPHLPAAAAGVKRPAGSAVAGATKKPRLDAIPARAAVQQTWRPTLGKAAVGKAAVAAKRQADARARALAKAKGGPPKVEVVAAQVVMPAPASEEGPEEEEEQEDEEEMEDEDGGANAEEEEEGGDGEEEGCDEGEEGGESGADPAGPIASVPAPPSSSRPFIPAFLTLPFQEAYMLLGSAVDWDAFTTYSALRAQAFVVIPHAAALEVPPPGAGHAEEAVGTGLVHGECPLVVAFDVYARDGVSAFRMSAPGAPDAYVMIAHRGDAPPSPAQVRELSGRLTVHGYALQAMRAEVEASKKGSKKNVLELAAALGDRGGASRAVVRPPPPMDLKVAIVAGPIVTFYGTAGVEVAPSARGRAGGGRGRGRGRGR